MKYKYVVFNNIDSSIWKPDKDGYYAICLEDLHSMNGVKVVDVPLENRNFFFKLLYRLHNYGLFSRLFGFIPKSIWYPIYFDDRDYDSKDLICFVVISNLTADYLLYLRSRYPNAKFVKFFRDLVWTKQKWYDSYIKTNVIDYWITYDENEAQQYGMYYFPEVESKTYVNTDNSILYDVFFAGWAKKRLNQIIIVYDYLSSKGVRCFFYVTGVNEKDRVLREGIKYAEKPMKYRDMLRCNSHAKCILEINQENAIGYTSRFLEAVMYNKKLLTNNQSIKNTKFYNPQYIQCYENPMDIKTEFLLNDEIINYHYDNSFSPSYFINYLDKIIE